MNSLLLGGFVAALSTGLPIALAMMLASLMYIWVSGSIPPLTVVHRMVGGVDSFPLLAVPFFILAGNLMNSAGITNRIYNFALALVGWLKGGLGHVNVVGSVIFAGMSGTAIADAGGPGHHRDQGDEGPRLPDGIRPRDHRRVRHARPHHPAVAAAGDLRRAGQRLDRQAVRRRHRARRADGPLHDGHGRLLRARAEVRQRHARSAGRAWAAPSSSWASWRSRRSPSTTCGRTRRCRAGCASARCSSAPWRRTSSSSSRPTWRC